MEIENTNDISPKAVRVLAVLLKLSNGKANVSVKKSDLLDEINRSGVMRMSDAEFEDYRRSVVNLSYSHNN